VCLGAKISQEWAQPQARQHPWIPVTSIMERGTWPQWLGQQLLGENLWPLAVHGVLLGTSAKGDEGLCTARTCTCTMSQRTCDLHIHMILAIIKSVSAHLCSTPFPHSCCMVPAMADVESELLIGELVQQLAEQEEALEAINAAYEADPGSQELSALRAELQDAVTQLQDAIMGMQTQQAAEEQDRLQGQPEDTSGPSTSAEQLAVGSICRHVHTPLLGAATCCAWSMSVMEPG
jgi:hypothetical protein